MKMPKEKELFTEKDIKQFCKEMGYETEKPIFQKDFVVGKNVT